jgi:hypothetical protein
MIVALMMVALMIMVRSVAQDAKEGCWRMLQLSACPQASPLSHIRLLEACWQVSASSYNHGRRSCHMLV